MEIFFSPYKLTPLKRANRMSSLEPKEGIHLRAVINGTEVFADYFPHLPMGDRSCEQFLEEFKDQKDEYDQKLLNLLLSDKLYQKQSPIKFKNHQLWTGTEALEAKIYKYKLLSASDRTFIEILEKGMTLRLDANGMFTQATYSNFISSIPKELIPLIQYIEDPSADLDWKNLIIAGARDFIMGSPCEYYIYKPNCEFKPETSLPIIYSCYLGGNLGSWHTYCELVQSGDLSLTHGIISQGFSQEEKNFFQGNFKDGFVPDLGVVRDIYKDLNLSAWKSLCKISI